MVDAALSTNEPPTTDTDEPPTIDSAPPPHESLRLARNVESTKLPVEAIPS